MLKRIIAIVLTLIISVFPVSSFAEAGAGNGSAAAAANKQSYSRETAESAAQSLYEMGLFKGVSADSEAPDFALDKQMNRCEAITMLVRLLGKEKEALDGSFSIPFTDVPKWAIPYVGLAYKYGYTNGTSEITFGSKENISAVQYITFVLRALGYKDGSDFNWKESFLLSDALGITNGNYSKNSAFVRADAAIISTHALDAKIKNSERLLKDVAVSGLAAAVPTANEGAAASAGGGDGTGSGDGGGTGSGGGGGTGTGGGGTGTGGGGAVETGGGGAVETGGGGAVETGGGGAVETGGGAVETGGGGGAVETGGGGGNVPADGNESEERRKEPTDSDQGGDRDERGRNRGGSTTIKQTGPINEEFFADFDPEALGIPVIYLSGSISNISKENKVTVSAKYVDPSDSDKNFEGAATLKIQGNISTSFVKKNYSIQFYKDDTLEKKNKQKLFDDCGKQSKYCLKANYIDPMSSRNIVSARIYSQIVHSRNIDDELADLPNGGCIDGYPVLLYINDVCYGYYTMNIPKDHWMLETADDDIMGILVGETNNSSVMLKKKVGTTLKKSGWDVEYSYDDEEDPQWMKDSFNDFIGFVSESSDEDFKNNIAEYTDLDRTIDALIYTYFIDATDNQARNILWVTYDGVKWIPQMYDMDGTWGIGPVGTVKKTAKEYPIGSNLHLNALYERVWELFKNDVRARYKDLRSDILSMENISAQFGKFYESVPQGAVDAEKAVWPTLTARHYSSLDEILDYAEKRINYFDSLYGTPVKEEGKFSLRFNTGEHSKVLVYSGQDYTETPAELLTNRVYTEGNSGEDQINFKVVTDEGYHVDSVVAYGDYKNLKLPEETGEANVYRITKIAGTLQVKINVVKDEEDIPLEE